MASNVTRAKRVKPITGVDIGTSSLKLVDFDGTKITDARIISMPDNLMRDGHIVSSEMLSQVLREAKPAHKDCALMLYSSICYARRVLMPAMGVKELKLNLPYEFQDFVHDNGDDYRFDYALLEMINDEAGNPKEMDLLAAMVTNNVMDQFVQCFKKAGLRLKSAAPDVMAFANIIRTSPFPQDDFCFVNIGSNSTRVYLYPKGRFEVVRNIEFGSDRIAAAVARAKNIEQNLARTYLATNHEGCLDLPEAIEVYDAFATEIQRIVNFFGFNYRDSSLERIYYGGTACNVTQLMDVLAANVSVPLYGVTTLLDCADGVDRDVLLRCPVAAGMTLA